jgi:dTDP-4-amino-4,6-dideoxygalactose transaminase
MRPEMSWVPTKTIDHDNVHRLLDESLSARHLTNYGPNVRALETRLRSLMNINDDRAVIVTNSGAHALHATIDGINLFYKQTKTFATQDFTFPSALQGPLKGSIVVDVTDDMEFDLNELDGLDSLDPIPGYRTVDGIIVTNIFGHCCRLSTYVNYCEKKNLLLVFDNATGPLTEFEGSNINNYGDASIVSLHHTKPLGFGEGGVIVVKKKYEATIRGIMNFGYMNTGPRKWDPLGNNYKMSDVSAVYINDFLNTAKLIHEHHERLYKHFLKSVRSPITLFPDHSSSSLVSCIPFFLPFDTTEVIRRINAIGVEARQYYPALTGKPVSSQKFRTIVCLPCNTDMTTDVIDRCLGIVYECA